MGYSERAFTGLELGSNKLGKGASRGGAVGVGGGGVGNWERETPQKNNNNKQKKREMTADDSNMSLTAGVIRSPHTTSKASGLAQ